MERLLINIADVQVYHNIDPEYNDERFNAFLRGIQRRNLKDFLGDALYLDMMTNYTQSKYTDLISGKQYTYSDETIEYFGLKPILVYWMLAELTRKGDNFLTTYGSVEFTDNPQQQFQHSKTKELIALEYMNTAQGYENDAIKFLDTYKSTYTLWDTKDQKPGTQFTTIKIS